MEFTLPPPAGPALARGLARLLRSFGLNPRTLNRNACSVIYVKESEDIADALKIMEADKALMLFEDVRIKKEISNSVNRRVNFETANLKKTVGAAMNVISDIQYIEARRGLAYLSSPLDETARLRIAYEDASLAEIGRMMEKPVGKSGVNHRLRKISEIAETLRKENGDP
jgi:hypothetical protein